VESHKIVRDVSTGYSYGYGFAVFKSKEDAEKAVQQLDKLKLQNKTLKVRSEGFLNHAESFHPPTPIRLGWVALSVPDLVNRTGPEGAFSIDSVPCSGWQ